MVRFGSQMDKASTLQEVKRLLDLNTGRLYVKRATLLFLYSEAIEHESCRLLPSFDG